MNAAGLTNDPAALARRRQIRAYIARVSVACLCLLVLVSLYLFATQYNARLEREIRADCAFKLTVANLPSKAKYPSMQLVELATSARNAYIRKGCRGTTDPDTGQRFPPPPPVFTVKTPPPSKAP